jgi:hypothetical protein
VNALLAGVQYSGLTPLATSMAAKVLQPIVYNLAASGQLAKPVLVLTITDGEPTDNPRDLVVQVRFAAPSHCQAPAVVVHCCTALRPLCHLCVFDAPVHFQCSEGRPRCVGCIAIVAGPHAHIT